jgi:hypothetical protein
LQERCDVSQKSMHRSDFNPVRTGHRWQCVKDLIDQRVGVDQNDQIARTGSIATGQFNTGLFTTGRAV